MLIFIVITLGTFICDQAIKSKIERKPADYFPHYPCRYICVTRVHNHGLMLRFLQKRRWLTLLIPSIILLFFLAFCLTPFLMLQRVDIFVALGLLIGGALGNISDRYIRGFVVDWLVFCRLPGRRLKRLAFNLADLAIVIGAIPLLIHVLEME